MTSTYLLPLIVLLTALALVRRVQLLRGHLKERIGSVLAMAYLLALEFIVWILGIENHNLHVFLLRLGLVALLADEVIRWAFTLFPRRKE